MLFRIQRYIIIFFNILVRVLSDICGYPLPTTFMTRSNSFTSVREFYIKQTRQRISTGSTNRSSIYVLAYIYLRYTLYSIHIYINAICKMHKTTVTLLIYTLYKILNKIYWSEVDGWNFTICVDNNYYVFFLFLNVQRRRHWPKCWGSWMELLCKMALLR